MFEYVEDLLKVVHYTLPSDLRAEFAVAHPGANFHSWPDIAHGPDQIAFGVSGNAVTAAKRGVGAEHA